MKHLALAEIEQYVTDALRDGLNTEVCLPASALDAILTVVRVARGINLDAFKPASGHQWPTLERLSRALAALETPS